MLIANRGCICSQMRWVISQKAWEKMDKPTKAIAKISKKSCLNISLTRRTNSQKTSLSSISLMINLDILPFFLWLLGCLKKMASNLMQL